MLSPLREQSWVSTAPRCRKLWENFRTCHSVWNPSRIPCKILLQPLHWSHQFAVNPPREPWVSPPERYDGNLGQCKTFLMQCGLVFALQPLTSATERSKIAYLIGLLRGAALEWASVHWRRQDQVTTTYVAFTTEMTKVFDHPVQGNDASMRLFTLHQGLRSVAEYAIEFRTLAVESGWNNESLLAVFINGLSERLKDELVTHPEPVNLDNLIALTIRIDNLCRERRRQKQHSPASEVIPRRRDPDLYLILYFCRSPCGERSSRRGSPCSWVGTVSVLMNKNAEEETTPASTVDNQVITSPTVQTDR